MNAQTAKDIQANSYGIDWDADFHTLNSDAVESIVDLASLYKYRAPRNANGSRARYFHSAVRRGLARSPCD